MTCSSPGKICVYVAMYGSISTAVWTAAQCGANGVWQRRESCSYVNCGMIGQGQHSCEMTGDGGALVTSYLPETGLAQCDGGFLPTSPISF